MIDGWFVRATGRIVVSIGLMLVGLAVIGALWWVLAWFSAEREADALGRRWAEMGRSFESFEEKFPPRVANAGAVRLEELARPLGIDLVPRTVEGRSGLDDDEKTEFEAVEEAVKDFVALAARSNRLLSEPLPAELSDYLDRHGNELGMIVDHLGSGELPAWEQDISKAHRSPLPDLVGHIYLTRVLVAWSIALGREGRLDDSGRALEAAWRLSSTALRRPELISQYIGLAEAQLVAGAMRNHPEPEVDWPQLLMGNDFRESFFDAVQFEAWTAIEGARLHQILGDTAFGRVYSPLVTRGMVAYGEVLQRAVGDLPKRRFADFDAGEEFAAAIETLSTESFLARTAMADVWDGWARMGRAALCVELGAAAIEERRRIAGGAGFSGAADSVEQPSAIFPSVSWRIGSNADGVTIEPTQSLPVYLNPKRDIVCSSWFEPWADHD